MFPWVRLVNDEVMKALREGDSTEELEHLLSGIPTELEEIYTRTLRRPDRTQFSAPPRMNYERYVIFQMVKCCREPIGLYDLLAASLFLASGRGPYPDLRRLF